MRIQRFAVALALTGLVACDDDEDTMAPPAPTTFNVTVQNVSAPGTVNTAVAMGVVPLSPGVWAVFRGANPAFTPGAPSDVGTERIAEDGFVTQEDQSLSAAANVSSNGTFDAPGGNVPAIEPGETASFTVTAVPGERLTLETMFVQSNDYFYAFGGDGIALFEANGDPISGNVTSQVELWDSGTEVDEPLGGANQKLMQDPMDEDIGPSEGENVQLVSQTQPAFAIPAVTAVIRVTVTPQQ